MAENNPMLDFLIDNGVTDEEGIQHRYWEALKKEGYDDYHYFINTMSESDVKEMCRDSGIEKKNHIKKILNGWKLLQCKKDDAEIITKKTETDSSDIPADVKLLIIPNPINEKQLFCNEVVTTLYHDCFGLIKKTTFLEYTSGQMEERFDLHLEKQKISNLITLMNTSKDGNWHNVREFSTSDYYPKYKNVIRAKNTVKFIDRHVETCSKFVTRMNERKRYIYSRTEILPHKVNELEFLKSLNKEVTSVADCLMEKKVAIETKLKLVNGVVEDMAQKSEATRQRKRALENINRGIADRVKRDMKSAINVLEKLECSNSEVASKIGSSNFNFTLSESDFKVEKFHLLRQKMHLNGLRLLHEKGVFGEESKLSNIVYENIKILEKKKEGLKDGLEEKTQVLLNAKSTKSEQQLLPGVLSIPSKKKKTILRKPNYNQMSINAIMETWSKKSEVQQISDIEVTDDSEDDHEYNTSAEYKDLVAEEGADSVHFSTNS